MNLGPIIKRLVFEHPIYKHRAPAPGTPGLSIKDGKMTFDPFQSLTPPIP